MLRGSWNGGKERSPLGTRKNPLRLHLEQGSQVRGAVLMRFPFN